MVSCKKFGANGVRVRVKRRLDVLYVQHRTLNNQTCYYISSDGIWTHDPPWSSRMLYHWATGDSARPRDAVPVNTHNLTLAHHRVSSSSVVEHPTRSRRVVGSYPIWDFDFFRVYVSPRIYVISCFLKGQENPDSTKLNVTVVTGLIM